MCVCKCGRGNLGKMQQLNEFFLHLLAASWTALESLSLSSLRVVNTLTPTQASTHVRVMYTNLIGTNYADGSFIFFFVNIQLNCSNPSSFVLIGVEQKPKWSME